MPLIDKRKNEQTPLPVSTHRIWIGWNATPDATRKTPIRLPGFVITRTALSVKTSELLIDVDAMRALCPEAKGDPWTPWFRQPQINSSRVPINCPPLPSQLDFALPASAEAHGNQWDFGEMFSEQYQAWGKDFIYTSNGVIGVLTWRGTRIVMRCPISMDDAEYAEWLKKGFPFVRDDLKCNMDLIIVAYVITEGYPRPLNNFGFSAKYLFHTTSERTAIRTRTVLEDAANRLGGRIGGIPGRMTLGKERVRMLGGGQNSSLIVPRVVTTLDEMAIQRMERVFFPAIEAPDERRALPAPTEPIDTEEPEEPDYDSEPEPKQTEPDTFESADESEEVVPVPVASVTDMMWLLDWLGDYAIRIGRGIETLAVTKGEGYTKPRLKAGLQGPNADKAASFLKNLCSRFESEDPAAWTDSMPPLHE